MMDLIPREIFLEIITYIPHIRDRNSVSQVSKKLYSLALPTLYESIIIRSPDEFDLKHTDIDRFLRTADQQYFRHVKSIIFVAPIEKNVKFRCIHHKLLEDVDQDAIDSRDEQLTPRVNDLGDLMPQIRPLFQVLPDNHLRSFHWHLGTCIPQDVLGPGGYLPITQRSIEDLSLITADPCILPKDGWKYPIVLTEFKLIKKFSWSGGLSREDFHALRDMLRIQSTNLEVLKVDLIDWWDAQYDWADDIDEKFWIRDHNFFGERVLELAPGETHVRFPSLKSLSFSHVNFHGASFEIAHMFNISTLNSLNLRDCPYAGSLLRKVVESGDPINLRSLELVVRDSSDDSSHDGWAEDENWIVPFLNSFEGLTNLLLLVFDGNGVATTDRYWPSIFHHKKSLKRLVYHQIRTDFLQMNCNTNIDDKVLDLFKQMNLECLGLCLSPTIPPEESFSQLTPAQVSTLKFLGLRYSSPHSDFEQHFEHEVDGSSTTCGFAKWAFNAFPNLLFIAFGDFSYGRQFVTHPEMFHSILHRYPFPGVDSNDDFPNIKTLKFQNSTGNDGFRRLNEGDHRFSVHLEQFRDVLEACPMEPFYEKDF